MKKFFLAIVLLSVFKVDAQVQTKISQMPVLDDPTGAYVPVVKGGVNYKALIDSIKGKAFFNVNTGGGFRLAIPGTNNIKSLGTAGNTNFYFDSTVSGQLRLNAPTNISAFTNDAGYITSAATPNLDAVTTGTGNNVTLHSLTVGDLTSYDNFGGSNYVQVSGLNQRITFSGSSLLNLYRTNVTGTAKSIQFPNISGTLAEGATNGTTTVHAGTDGIIDISTLLSSGSGTVNSGTQYQLGYYSSTGTGITGLTLITPNKALISNANGLPVASTATSSDLDQWHLAAVAQTLTDGSTITMNCSNGYVATVTLGGNRTIAFTNVPVNRQITINVIQDATGNRTLTFPAATYIPLGFGTGTVPNLSTAGASWDVLYLNYDGAKYTLQFSKSLSH